MPEKSSFCNKNLKLCFFSFLHNSQKLFYLYCGFNIWEFRRFLMKNVFFISAIAILLVFAFETSAQNTNNVVNNIKQEDTGKQPTESIKQVEQFKYDIEELKKEVVFQSRNEMLKLYEETISFKLTLTTILVAILGVFITFFGLGIPFLGFYYGRKSLEKIDRLQEYAKKEVKVLIDDSEKKVDYWGKKMYDYDKEAREILMGIRRKNEEISYLTEDESSDKKNESLKEKEKEREKRKEKASELKNDPKANPYEKSIAEAAENYFSDNYENALNLYEDIIKYYKDEITVTTLLQIYSRMAYMYLEMSNNKKKIEERKNLLHKAEDKYKEVLKLDEKNANAYCSLGVVFAKRADLETEDKEKKALLDKAKKEFEEALKLDIKDANTYDYYGIAFMKQADLETETEKKEISLNEAEKYCLKCQRLDGGVYNLACVYAIKYNLNKNETDKDNAFKYLKEALKNKEETFDFVENDKDFYPLIDEPQYKELKKDYGEDN
jgi:tetratricopeptide (TPR) repeat protein